jgi:hypothetical protein
MQKVIIHQIGNPGPAVRVDIGQMITTAILDKVFHLLCTDRPGSAPPAGRRVWTFSIRIPPPAILHALLTPMFCAS